MWDTIKLTMIHNEQKLKKNFQRFEFFSNPVMSNRKNVFRLFSKTDERISLRIVLWVVRSNWGACFFFSSKRRCYEIFKPSENLYHRKEKGFWQFFQYFASFDVCRWYFSTKKKCASRLGSSYCKKISAR